MKNRFSLSTLLLLIFFFLSYKSIYSEYFYSKNGKIIEGNSKEYTNNLQINQLDEGFKEIGFTMNPNKIREQYLSIDVNLSFFVPLGDFQNQFFLGTGLLVDFNIENLFKENLMFGLSTGYWYLFANQVAITHGHIIPLLATMAYRIDVHMDFFITPKISAGAAFNIVNYDTTIISGVNEIEMEIKPIVIFHLAGGFKLTNKTFLKMSINYGFFIENAKLLNFLTFNCGAIFYF